MEIPVCMVHTDPESQSLVTLILAHFPMTFLPQKILASCHYAIKLQLKSLLSKTNHSSFEQCILD